MLDKSEILANFIKLQEVKLASLRESLDSTQNCARDAPGSNESHSDTSKFQYSNLALGLQKNINDAEGLLIYLKSIDLSPRNIVSSGALVKIEDETSKDVATYFIIQRGGDILKVNDTEISFITFKAPLAQAIVGKKIGNKVEFMGRTYKIIYME